MIFLLAEATPEEPIPDEMEEVKATILETLGEVWRSFLEHTPYLVCGVLTLLATWLAARLVTGVMGKTVIRRLKVRQSLRELFLRFVAIGIWVAGLLLTAMIVFPGLTPSKALGALGLLSIAVGLAFKDIFENFFAGILLLWRFPFENGDFIECEGITGRVEEVQIRMTTIRRTTGELVVVPNSFLFQNPVQVLTSEPRRRVHLLTGVAYGEDVGQAVEVIERAVRSCDTVDTSRPLQVFPKEFGSSSIDIDVAWWTGSKPVDMRRSRGEVLTAVKKALDEAGIEIPFPYRTLTFKETLPVRKLEGDE